jgi:hypothetical protein
MNALRLPNDEPLARRLVKTIHAGQLETVKELVQAHPGLASARLAREGRVANAAPCRGRLARVLPQRA